LFGRHRGASFKDYRIRQAALGRAKDCPTQEYFHEVNSLDSKCPYGIEPRGFVFAAVGRIQLPVLLPCAPHLESDVEWVPDATYPLKGIVMSELVAKAKVLIRCPALKAFDAFVQPELITRFWLQATSGPLAAGAQVEWQFMVPGATEHVNVTKLDQPQHIAFTWSGGGLDVDIRFSALQNDITVVSVEVRGFKGEDQLDQVVDATEGFSIVLCDLKIFLESGRSPNLVKDKAELIRCSQGG
jgi:uncharacterized protein YndB with AHSA1/START domain